MNILLIISGSVAAYKSLDVVRELKRRNHNLLCAISRCGEQFVTSLSVTALAGHYTYTESDFFSLQASMKHISLSRNSDLILVAPASANIIAKAAHGICDDLVSTILTCAKIPIVMAPAMNTAMWEAKATLRNLEILKRDDVQIIEPETGILACGEEGYGKMASVQTIVTYIENASNNA
ncbi:phosphopantothenoylcysteine decarboxylase [Anaplasma capra]|uniref:phosphopantothenoylcysteine decarboxylase n=1 Tax=Anaplasma capra TaxID=1562740 RepID=UPI0021D58B43|nr:phosphopantothenoylcysteine decarboxylase [Anaplasma capra]MCU7611215.1 phosphopantothenoylcysteine decarboxylase [Anaplasma capra]MCU7612281.1 phosphopantothenoylcysteine decarboxylase [Anaplasma capra]